MRYQIHPYCLIFPPAESDEAYKLREDIRKHGQRVAIILFQGKILDGRSRYEACLKIGKEPHFEKFKGTEQEALDYVVSLNLYRRHLNASQKAAVAKAVDDKLVKAGVPRETAKKLALAATGASNGSYEAFKRIEEESPKVAKAIANGETTIGHEQKQREAPTAISRVLRSIRDASCAANAAGRCLDSSVSQHVKERVRMFAANAESLVEELEMAARKL